ncbi:MAG: permease prefix domain 1-containing protein [Dehalococcoidia bacterium]|nr:permease prefix domain 1-containing protein [Dehalococcoidia bacterium]
MDLRTELNRYLQNIKENLRLDPNSEKEIIRELEAHVEDRCQEMQKNGLTAEEALERCLRLLGPARHIARQIYETHSQGTWRQALLAGLPHLFFAALFALNWLTGVTWVPILLIVIAGVVFYSFFQNKPTWLFPWLGYALFPVVTAGISLLYLPRGWAWMTLLLYVPLILWLSCFITVKFIKRDWLYSTLMLLPVPTFAGWFLASQRETVYPDLKLGFFYEYAPWTGFTFLVLGISVALFIRLRNRWLRILALGVSGFTTSAVIILTSRELGLLEFMELAVMMVSFLLIPAFIQHRVHRSHRNNTASGVEVSA